MANPGEPTIVHYSNCEPTYRPKWDDYFMKLAMLASERATCPRMHCGCVIVKDLSRLGRNSIDTGYYIAHNFHSRNVRFITINERIVFCIRGKPDLVKKCLLLGGR